MSIGRSGERVRWALFFFFAGDAFVFTDAASFCFTGAGSCFFAGAGSFFFAGVGSTQSNASADCISSDGHRSIHGHMSTDVRGDGCALARAVAKRLCLVMQSSAPLLQLDSGTKRHTSSSGST